MSTVHFLLINLSVKKNLYFTCGDYINYSLNLQKMHYIVVK